MKDFSFPFLRANWIDGLKLNKHVQKPEKFRGVLHNSRETGNWCFVFDKFATVAYLAYDVLKCTGVHNCALNERNQCDAGLKILYCYDREKDTVIVKIFIKGRELSHGPQFLPNPIIMNLGRDVRAAIVEMSELKLKPLLITFTIANKVVKNGVHPSL